MTSRRKKRVTVNLSAKSLATEAASLGQPTFREFKLRLPPDVSQRIEAKAKAEGRPQNRVIINELANIPYLEGRRDFEDAVEDMKIVLARYSTRIVVADLSDDLLRTLHEVLKADEMNNIGELRARLQRLRVLLTQLKKIESATNE
jgi:hypothetical protein